MLVEGLIFLLIIIISGFTGYLIYFSQTIHPMIDDYKKEIKSEIKNIKKDINTNLSNMKKQFDKGLENIERVKMEKAKRHTLLTNDNNSKMIIQNTKQIPENNKPVLDNTTMPTEELNESGPLGKDDKAIPTEMNQERNINTNLVNNKDFVDEKMPTSNPSEIVNENYISASPFSFF